VQILGAELGGHQQLNFTRRYDSGWEGINHQVSLGHSSVTQALQESQSAANN
jgi:hypothetical protein